MLDNQLYSIIIPALRDQLASFVSASYPELPPPLVDQSYQPTQQGAPELPQPFILINKIDNYRYGWRGRKDKWNAGTQKMVHTEIQVLETTFRVQALFVQEPTNVNGLTASDLANITADIIDSDTFMDMLQTNDIGLLRIGEVRNADWKDDTDRFEFAPSFDFTVTHKSTTISETPVIEQINTGIYPI